MRSLTRDQDDFIRNRLTMLGEGRFGLGDLAAVVLRDRPPDVGAVMEPHVCPGCDCLYRPRHAREAERCWSCVGMTMQEHVAAIEAATGERVVAHRDGARPSSAPAPGTEDYKAAIAELLRR